MTVTIVNVYRDTADPTQVRAMRLRTEGHDTYTITHKVRDHGPRWVVTGGWPPEEYITRWYCPGHNGHVCFYGMCDETRYTGPLPDQAEIDAHPGGTTGGTGPAMLGGM